MFLRQPFEIFRNNLDGLTGGDVLAQARAPVRYYFSFLCVALALKFGYFDV
jgi:hypothetical protein